LLKFTDYISNDFFKLSKFIFEHGFKVGVVGGTVRDYYLGQPNKHDYDCELRPKNSDADFYLKFSELIEDLYEFYEIEALPYGVYRIIAIDFECELTLPRKEIFKNEFHHSNFDVKFIKDDDYLEGFKRRDFTLNSIMMEFSGSWELVDPMNGVEALKSGKLIPCSGDFYLDPVRFLRSIRFHLKYGFQIDEDILIHLKTISTDNFSAHYIRSEALKSAKPLTFLLTFLKLSESNKESKYLSLIDKHEEQYREESFKTLISNHLYLESNIFNELIFLLNLSIKEMLIDEVFRFRDFIAMDIHEFKKKYDSVLVLNVFKKLSLMNQSVIDFLFENEIIDLRYEEIQLLKSRPVDISKLENSEKKYSSFLQKVDSYFAI
jgi:tRNA nucleotidyltransferase/poly(A) polymerase